MARVVRIAGGKFNGLVGEEGLAPEGGWTTHVEVHTATRVLKVKPYCIVPATAEQTERFYKKIGRVPPVAQVTNEQEAAQP